jgi:hypothetical protein
VGAPVALGATIIGLVRGEPTMTRMITRGKSVAPGGWDE